ncbi:MAG: hypothetical protein COT71_02125 [Candidatus Andersenbacteria bacterium CG10_big_fil_rev_8_21_14_0_10_54_11]|uniref:Uncharacterized protein n=1 Tax=Candidatus Andersenbacteria bacterium CG10_big_fil_rev_8_21_14_0_10_54_11 TaxID=1974485 RepID=A0A2M6WZJ0_9BACT|nr:MAG: hypothetical protein COT71_02125 [Candidatus Andersenbacteria bacterium CG10_big_fil_rev_8_21_14_0_10_54_11]
MPIRFFLGIVGSVAAGVFIGSWLGLSSRELLFPAAAAGGMYVLAVMRRSALAEGLSTATPAVTPLLPAPAGHQLKADQQRDLVQELNSQQVPLTAEQARQWLDDFLIQQQS